MCHWVQLRREVLPHHPCRLLVHAAYLLWLLASTLQQRAFAPNLLVQEDPSLVQSLSTDPISHRHPPHPPPSRSLPHTSSSPHFHHTALRSIRRVAFYHLV